MAAPTATLTARSFFDRFLRVPSAGGRLVAMQLHPAQEQLIDAWDQCDPATGLPHFTELAALWIKKCGKSTTAGGLVLAELVAGSEPDREVTLTASDLAQSKDVVLASCVRFVRRNAWLSKHVEIRVRELIYRETVVDQRTGGRHVQEHVVRSIPVRDTRSAHGLNPSLVVFDELWAQQDYGAIEALAPSPTRRVSRSLYCSYAGLRSQAREGSPLWDLWQRWRAGSDLHLFVSHIGGPDGWRAVPWITEGFIDAQRRKFAAVPSKFRRLWCNEWAAGDEGTFLSGEEIASAVVPDGTEAPAGIPGVEYVIGIDLGITHDWSAVVVSHVGADHKLAVDVVRYWRGSRARPVSISEIEDEIGRLAARFKVGRVVADFWQSKLLAERLSLRGLHNVVTAPITPQRLDHLATSLKSAFARRMIRIPGQADWSAVLIEQLETIVGAEQGRRDLVRFTSGNGSEAGRHDDLVIALALTLEAQQGEIGRAVLPASFRACNRELNTGLPVDCFITKRGGCYVPQGDASCSACPGWQFVKQARAEHVARGGQAVDFRTFRRLFIVNNDWLAARMAQQMARACGI